MDNGGVFAERLDGHVQYRRLATSPGARDGDDVATIRWGSQDILCQLLREATPVHGTSLRESIGRKPTLEIYIWLINGVFSRSAVCDRTRI